MNENALWGLSERTLVSILRTVLYTGVATLVAMNGSEASVLLDAVVLGAFLADTITWLARSLMLLPNNVLHGGYEALVNLSFACFFYFRAAHFQVADDGTSIAAAFVAFMLVLGVKVGYYGLQSVQAIAQD